MIITGSILAFDLATSTGWASGPAEPLKPQFGTHVFPSTGERIGRHQSNMRDWLVAMIEFEQPSYVIFEQPSLFGKTTPTTMRKLCAGANTLEEVCDKLGVRCEQGNPSKIKKFWTGKGNAKKPDMVARARKCGFAVRNDDEADSIAHWFWAVFCYGTDDQKRRIEQMIFHAGMGVSPTVAA